MDKKTIRVASFDIGKKNFAEYVEDWDPLILASLAEKYRALPKEHQRRTKGPVSEDWQELMEQMFFHGTRVHWGVYDFRDDPYALTLDLPTRKNFLKHLSEQAPLWETCDLFLVEQQYVRLPPISGEKQERFRTGVNLEAIKLGEATLMWFLDHYPSQKVISVSSMWKTQMLGAPEKMKDRERKRWAEQKVEEIFRRRKDEEILSLYALARQVKGKRLAFRTRVYEETWASHPTLPIRRLARKIALDRQKWDDLADVVLQIQAYKYRYEVARW